MFTLIFKIFLVWFVCSFFYFLGLSDGHDQMSNYYKELMEDDEDDVSNLQDKEVDPGDLRKS